VGLWWAIRALRPLFALTNLSLSRLVLHRHVYSNEVKYLLPVAQGVPLMHAYTVVCNNADDSYENSHLLSPAHVLSHILTSHRPLRFSCARDCSFPCIPYRSLCTVQVYLPMEGGCQDPVYNTWQVVGAPG